MFTGGFQPRSVTFKANRACQDAINELGRTEDLHLSPDGRRLAIVGFRKRQLLVLDLAIRGLGKSRVVIANHSLRISSPDLNYPHGVFWVDDERLVVANRGSDVGLFAVPRANRQGDIELEPIAKITVADFKAMSAPGSVSVCMRGPRQADVLICNNAGHTVSRHTLHLGNENRFSDHEILLSAGLNIPDGVVHGPSGKVIAVSNHHARCVDIYDAQPGLGRRRKPIATLGGFGYPHGLRFSQDEQFLFVADAAEPFVHAFRRGPNGWQHAQEPLASLRVMSNAAFVRGHINAEEGGPKGIVLWDRANLMAITCEETPIAFFDVSPVLAAEDALPVAMKREAAGTRPLPPKAPNRSPPFDFLRWLRHVMSS